MTSLGVAGIFEMNTSAAQSLARPSRDLYAETECSHTISDPGADIRMGLPRGRLRPELLVVLWVFVSPLCWTHASYIRKHTPTLMTNTKLCSPMSPNQIFHHPSNRKLRHQIIKCLITAMSALPQKLYPASKQSSRVLSKP